MRWVPENEKGSTVSQNAVLCLFPAASDAHSLLAHSSCIWRAASSKIQQKAPQMASAIPPTEITAWAKTNGCVDGRRIVNLNSPLIRAFHHELLEGGCELEFRGVFPNTLQAFPHAHLPDLIPPNAFRSLTLSASQRRKRCTREVPRSGNQSVMPWVSGDKQNKTGDKCHGLLQQV